MTKEDEARLLKAQDEVLTKQRGWIDRLIAERDAAIAERDAAITEGHISAIASKVNAKVAARWDAENCALRAQVDARTIEAVASALHAIADGVRDKKRLVLTERPPDDCLSSMREENEI